ncbi:MAG: biopolymer transporter ExbD [Deltaproteobacteria bacterium]|nr:biopolymer transporter ExbD [Deltaproteobacteria bacterium]MBN2671519.1 biopolymer transporter ExbD [Deltaproteobacteria bacterium]
MASTMQDDDEEIISNINVTPFVDVTLVLLIIFMVTATYIVAQSIPVDLPEAATGEDVVTTLAVTITKDGTMYVDGKKSSDSQLESIIKKTQGENEDVRVIIAADSKVIHGKVVHMIDLVRQLGVSKFAINIDAPKKDASEKEK